MKWLSAASLVAQDVHLAPCGPIHQESDNAWAEIITDISLRSIRGLRYCGYIRNLEPPHREAGTITLGIWNHPYRTSPKILQPASSHDRTQDILQAPAERTFCIVEEAPHTSAWVGSLGSVLKVALRFGREGPIPLD